MTEQSKNNGKAGLLVDYVDKNLPPMRSGVEMIPVDHEGKELIYFHDPEGYLEKPFVLDKNIAAFFPMLNGNHSVRDILGEIRRYGSDVDESQLLAFVQQLDEARLLLSPWFRRHKEMVENDFETSRVRPPVCAGQTYPAEAKALREMLGQSFDAEKQDETGVDGVKALFAPHIDLRVGLHAYIPAFRPLAELRPTRVALLATSHYAGMYHPTYVGTPFVATRKDFETPLGTVPVDQKAMDIIENRASECGCSFQDRAHRNEHSIELHLIFLQYLWSHSFKLVPLLVGSLEEMYYKSDGDIGKKVDAMAGLLREKYGDDEDTLFVISGDLAHVGKKFGDNRPASEMFREVKSFDEKFLESAQEGDRAGLLKLMKETYDPYRICGFPPLYTALSVLPDLKGAITSYELWDEREQDSAVTFGSLLYRQNH